MPAGKGVVVVAEQLPARFRLTVADENGCAAVVGRVVGGCIRPSADTDLRSDTIVVDYRNSVPFAAADDVVDVVAVGVVDAVVGYGRSWTDRKGCYRNWPTGRNGGLRPHCQSRVRSLRG